jgi:hypothetical protein
MRAQVSPTAQRMPQNDLPNFSIFGRIFFGVIAILLVLWLLRLSGIV